MGQLLEALKGITLPSGADAVVAEADRLLTEWPEKAAYIEYLEAEIKRLRVKSGEPTAGTGLTFDADNGTYIALDGQRYCARCLTKEDKRSPLQNEQYGWRCPVCGKFSSDPSRPLPTVVTRPRGSGRI